MKRLLLILALCWPLLASEIYATFESEAMRHANLSLQATGVIASVHAQVGDRVKQGDLLLALESSEQKALLAIAQVEHDQAKNRYDRFVLVRSSLSTEEFEAHEAAFFRARANLAYHRALLDNRRLVAPFDGVIADRRVHEGDLIQNATQGAFLILQEDRSRLVVSFDQRHLGQVKKGDRLLYRLDGQTQKSEAEITALYPAVDATSRKAQAEAIVSGVAHGLFGQGRILTAKE